MTLKTRDDFVHLESMIESNAVQIVTGGTLTIPGSMPAVERIVKVSAMARIKEQWVEEGQVNVEGTLIVHLVYGGRYEQGQAYYGSIQSMEVAAFSHSVELPGARPPMGCRSKAIVLDLQPTLRGDGRTVDIDFVLELWAAVFQTQELLLLTDALTSPPQRLKVAKEAVRFHDVVGVGMAETELKEVLPIPLGAGSLVRILELGGFFKTADNRVVADRGVVSGTISYKALCVVVSEQTGEEELAVFRWDNISRVELAVEIIGARPGMTVCETVEPPTIVGRVSNAGQAIAVEGLQVAEIKVVQPRDIAVVTDIEADIGSPLALRVEPVSYERIGEGVSKDVQVSNSLDLPDIKPPLERLLDVDARAVVAEVTAAAGRVNVNAYLDLSALYVARTDDFTQPAYYASWGNAAPFEVSFSMPGVSAESDFETDVTVLDVRGEPLSRETISFHGTLRVTCRMREKQTKDVVAEAVEMRQYPGRVPTYTSITLQTEDSLWQLATKYGMTIEALVEQNPILADLDDERVLPIGSKILINRQGSAIV